MYDLPKDVTVNGNSFPVRKGGDYRLILEIISDLLKAFRQNGYKGTTEIELKYLYSAIIGFFDNIDTLADVTRHFPDINEPIKAIYRFINCGQDEIQTDKRSLKLIDWEQDEKLIVSAVNNVVKTEIRALPYLHWWTFIGYYMAIGECSLSSIVSIRSKIAKGKKLEKHEKEFKKENPEYFMFRSSQDDLVTLREQINEFVKR